MPSSSARSLHRRLKSAARDLERAEKNVVALFSEVLKRKIYRELGYGTIHLYASAELGFSSSKTSQFIRLAESLESLPALRREVKKGAMPWTKAREVAKVATPKTEKAWIGVAANASRRELETTIAESRAEAKAAKRSGQPVLPGRAPSAAPNAPIPSSVTLRFTPEQFALFEVLLERLHKQGVRGSREELLLAAMEQMGKDSEKPSGKSSSGRAPYQVTVTTCPKCRSASMPTSRGDARLDAAVTAAVLSDCDRVYPGRRKRSAIPPRTRRAVLERARHRCETTGCGRTTFLEIDHIIPVAAGGTNDVGNLRVLCSACHRARHRREIGGGGLVDGRPDGEASLPG